MNQRPELQTQQSREPEWQGPIWKHPYFIYVWLTLALFGFLLLMGFLALTQGWIPQR